MDNWYERSRMNFRDGETVYLVKFKDGTFKYVDEEEYQRIKDEVEVLDQLPAKLAPMMGDQLERFDRYLH